MQRYFIQALVFLAVVLALAITVHSADVTFQWELYSAPNDIDGFYGYLCSATPCEPLPANRVFTSTNKSATSQGVTGIGIGQKYGIMTAFKGTVESVKSVEKSVIVRPNQVNLITIIMGATP